MKTKYAVSLAALTVSAALSASAVAQTTVNFEGKVVDGACTATAGDSNTVKLNQIDKAALPSANAATTQPEGRTKFNVVLSGCDPSPKNYQINFSHASASNGRLPNQVAAGGAENVSLQLLSNTTTPTVIDVTPSPSTTRLPSAKDPGIDVSGAAGSGTGTGTYYVEYFREGGEVTAGAVKASAVMTLNWL